MLVYQRVLRGCHSTPSIPQTLHNCGTSGDVKFMQNHSGYTPEQVAELKVQQLGFKAWKKGPEKTGKFTTSNMCQCQCMSMYVNLTIKFLASPKQNGDFCRKKRILSIDGMSRVFSNAKTWDPVMVKNVENHITSLSLLVLDKGIGWLVVWNMNRLVSIS